MPTEYWSRMPPAEDLWRLALFAAVSIAAAWYLARSDPSGERVGARVLREAAFWVWLACAYLVQHSAPTVLAVVWVIVAGCLAVALISAWKRGRATQTLTIRVVDTGTSFFLLVFGVICLLGIVLPDSSGPMVVVRPPIFVCAPLAIFCFAMALRREGFSAGGLHLRRGFVGWTDIVRWSWRDLEVLELRLRAGNPHRPPKVKLYVDTGDRSAVERLLGDQVGPARVLDDDGSTRNSVPGRDPKRAGDVR